MVGGVRVKQKALSINYVYPIVRFTYLTARSHTLANVTAVIKKLGVSSDHLIGRCRRYGALIE